MFSRLKKVDMPRSWLVESHNETFILQNAKTQPGFYFEKPTRFCDFYFGKDPFHGISSARPSKLLCYDLVGEQT